MKRKVFGVGLNKTGTTTLGACLAQLGFDHVEYARELAQAYVEGRMEPLWDAADRHESFEDWPWPFLWRELAARYPDARFVLTVRRSPEVWLASLIRHAYCLEPDDQLDRMYYGYRFPDNARREYLAFYERHNREVREALGERCRVLCWETGDGWAELCDFLELEAPEAPFPHANPAWTPPPRQMLKNRLQRWREAGALLLADLTGRPRPMGMRR